MQDQLFILSLFCVMNTKWQKWHKMVTNFINDEHLMFYELRWFNLNIFGFIRPLFKCNFTNQLMLYLLVILLVIQDRDYHRNIGDWIMFEWTIPLNIIQDWHGRIMVLQSSIVVSIIRSQEWRWTAPPVWERKTSVVHWIEIFHQLHEECSVSEAAYNDSIYF